MSQATEESNRRLLRARDAMDRTYAQPLDVAALARIAVTSQAHFSRTFRDTFGETPHRYLQRRRVERAMFLLRRTDRDVTEICLDVGFSSLGTFSRTFRDADRIPPAARRRAGAVVLCHGLDETEQFWRSAGKGPPVASLVDRIHTTKTAQEGNEMLKALTISSIYVLDQQQALDFYVGKLGLEVNTDQDLGFMRWLTVSVPGDKPREILLERPGQPSMDDKTAAQVRDHVTKGVAGGHLFFTTDDCRKTYKELKARGVEFTEEPTERPYGIDCGLRDPFGNHIRFSQPTTTP